MNQNNDQDNKPFDIGYATVVDQKHGKPMYKIHLYKDKIKQLVPNKKGLADLSLRFREDGKTIIAYENLYKSKGVHDERNFINLYTNYQSLLTAYESNGKITIVATPKDPSKKAINDFSKADYNVFSFQNTGDYKVIGSGFTYEENLRKETIRIKELNASKERGTYNFIGNMNSNGVLRLNDTNLQKFVDQTKENTTINLVKADNSEKYFCYLSTGHHNEHFSFKFSIPTNTLVNLPYRENEIHLQVVNIDSNTNKLFSDVAILTKSNYENAFHDYFIKDRQNVEIPAHDVISYGHSLEKLFDFMKLEHSREKSKDKSIVTQPQLFSEKRMEDKGIPYVKVNRELNPPTLKDDNKRNEMKF